jgi:uncharacterized protein YndB with AHSA1/START domain
MPEPTPLRFACRPEGLDFVDRAPKVLTFSAELAAAPPQVWHELADDASTWTAWFPMLTTAAYVGHGAATPGVGARRQVTVARGAGRFVETILAFDEGERFTWRVDSASVPAFAALVEDWRVEPLDGGARTRATWRFACDPRFLFKVASPLAPRQMHRTFTKAMANLEARIRNSSA